MARSQNLFTDDEIKDILDKDMLELMGAKDMPDEEKFALYEKIANTIQDRVLMRVDDALDEEGRAQFSQIINTGDQEKTNEFLLAKGLSIPQLLVQESMLYKLEIMSLFKISKNNTDTANQD